MIKYAMWRVGVAIKEMHKKRYLSAVKLHAHARGFIHRRRYLRYLWEIERNNAAVIVQKYIRRYLARNTLFALRAELFAVNLLQKNFRMLLAKRKLKRLRKQAKKRERMEKREITKRFEKQQKIDDEIEQLIENIYNREVQERKSSKQSSRRATYVPPFSLCHRHFLFAFSFYSDKNDRLKTPRDQKDISTRDSKKRSTKREEEEIKK